MVDYRINKTAPKLLTDNQLKTIENRQKLALLYRSKEKIEDFQDDVFNIIDEKGLNNDSDKTKLETALKVLPFIVPVKKAMEMTITSKKIEDLISESIEEAQIIDDKKVENGK
jgi:hypothetical protein